MLRASCARSLSSELGGVALPLGLGLLRVADANDGAGLLGVAVRLDPSRRDGGGGPSVEVARVDRRQVDASVTARLPEAAVPVRGMQRVAVREVGRPRDL